MSGGLKKWSVDKMGLVKDFGCVSQGGVEKMVIGESGEGLFVVSRCGKLKQWRVKEGRLVEDYGKGHDGRITSMVASGG